MMKDITKNEREEAKQIAHRQFYSPYAIAINQRKGLDVDLRTRVGRLALKFYEKLIETVDVDAVSKLQLERRMRKPKRFTNILDNPLVRDYLNNNPSAIYSDRLKFGHRNHWAKSERDKQILSVLKKYNELPYETAGGHTYE